MSIRSVSPKPEYIELFECKEPESEEEAEAVNPSRRVRFSLEEDQESQTFDKLIAAVEGFGMSISQLQGLQKKYIDLIEQRKGGKERRSRRAWKHLKDVEHQRGALEERSQSFYKTFLKTDLTAQFLTIERGEIEGRWKELKEVIEQNLIDLNIEFFWQGKADYYNQLVENYLDIISVQVPITIEEQIEKGDALGKEIQQLQIRAKAFVHTNTQEFIEFELKKEPLEEDEEQMQDFWKSLVSVERKRKLLEMKNRSLSEESDHPKFPELKKICERNSKSLAFEHFWEGELSVSYRYLEKRGRISLDKGNIEENLQLDHPSKIMGDMCILLTEMRNRTFMSLIEQLPVLDNPAARGTNVWDEYPLLADRFSRQFRQIEILRKGLASRAKEKEHKTNLKFEKFWPKEKIDIYNGLSKHLERRLKKRRRAMNSNCCVLV